LSGVPYDLWLLCSCQGEEKSYLAWAVEIVTGVLQTRIRNSPNDEIGVVFYGTVRTFAMQLMLCLKALGFRSNAFACPFHHTFGRCESASHNSSDSHYDALYVDAALESVCTGQHDRVGFKRCQVAALYCSAALTGGPQRV
jgi:hypothetical protein